MDRSLGFGSTSCNSTPYSDSLSLRLHLVRLNLATRRNSLAHYAKGTRSHVPKGHSASTACRHKVSGTISLPSLGYFSPFPHGTRSLSVGREYLALEDGPPRFHQGFTCPGVLGNMAQEDQNISRTRLSLSMAQLSIWVPLCSDLLTSRGSCRSLQPRPTTPCMQRRQSYTYTVWAWSPFARRY